MGAHCYRAKSDAEDPGCRSIRINAHKLNSVIVAQLIHVVPFLRLVYPGLNRVDQGRREWDGKH